jgi:hypothetical protein
LFDWNSGNTLGEALDSIQAGFQQSWRLVDGIHTLRSRLWYAEDALEVPLEKLRAWRKEGAEKRSYSVETLAEVGQLSDNQIERLVFSGLMPDLMGLRADPNLRDGLRVWGSLSAEERSASETRPVAVAGEPAALLKGQPLALSVGAEVPVLVRAEARAASDGSTLTVNYRRGEEERSAVLSPMHAGRQVAFEKAEATGMPTLGWVESHPVVPLPRTAAVPKR